MEPVDNKLAHAPERNIFDYKTGRLFPLPFLFFGFILLAAGIGFWNSHRLVTFIVVPVSFAILTAYTGIEINRSLHTFREYNSFFFIKFGAASPYGAIERIFFNSTKQTQQFTTMHAAQSMTTTDRVWNGYLKFGDGTKIRLTTRKKKEVLLKDLEKLSAFLQLPVEDASI